ncbi:MAG: thermonuclease family protein [Gemmatimonadaceae bacterium]|nr:thermonuclease family protein [Gemmatimonadaceae bacterium]
MSVKQAGLRNETVTTVLPHTATAVWADSEFVGFVKPTMARTTDEFYGHPAPFATTQWRAWMLLNYDGDTLTARFDSGFFGTMVRDVRVYGINAPELKTGSKVSRKRGLAAKNYLAAICPAGTPIALVTTMDPNPDDPSEKYGRILAKVTIYKPDGTTADLGALMLASGTGVVAYNPAPTPNPIPALETSMAKRGAKGKFVKGSSSKKSGSAKKGLPPWLAKKVGKAKKKKKG